VWDLSVTRCDQSEAHVPFTFVRNQNKNIFLCSVRLSFSLKCIYHTESGKYAFIVKLTSVRGDGGVGGGGGEGGEFDMCVTKVIYQIILTNNIRNETNFSSLFLMLKKLMTLLSFIDLKRAGFGEILPEVIIAYS
jgi:hypothetical protein